MLAMEAEILKSQCLMSFFLFPGRCHTKKSGLMFVALATEAKTNLKTHLFLGAATQGILGS
jgi:hypothetical protein